ncbi:hypothetical protein J4573_10940 [Actinomadura barringtoniae]|uniref:Uncharacterized protein n=1 Tax=Actinomadura barringtoniae TaxID=1427535 RepID=A0A939PE72_9ACTN|nr:hypothetical protein [Actinomadura barringtoniae]MBO2447604.1 hypothetical protein [Actinomadura barringtoniae]
MSGGTPEPPVQPTANDERIREMRELEAKSESAARLFDIRGIIGGLLSLYGVVLVITGLLDSDAEIDKAQGININLWTGLGMALVGGAFLAWWRLSPPPPPPAPPAAGDVHDEER